MHAFASFGSSPLQSREHLDTNARPRDCTLIMLAPPPPLLHCPPALCSQGYKDRRMERLRRGIGPESVSLVENVTPTEVPGLVREEMDELKA